MSLTPGNVSLLLSLLSTVAPGTWAIAAGILGAALGFFGKRLLKKNDCPTCSANTKPPSEIPRRDTTRRIGNPKRTKASSAARGNRGSGPAA